jgi:hypothetical protein
MSSCLSRATESPTWRQIADWCCLLALLGCVVLAGCQNLGWFGQPAPEYDTRYLDEAPPYPSSGAQSTAPPFERGTAISGFDPKAQQVERNLGVQ